MREQFHTSLTEGQAGERQWVSELQSLGRSVAHGQRVTLQNFTPGVDRCQHPDAAALFRIEIKTRSLGFTCPDDYPYSTVYLHNVAQEQRDYTPPLIYVLRSRPTGKWVWACILDRDDTWTVEDVTDTRRGTIVRTLVCPKRFLRPADTLMRYLMDHRLLGLLDGEFGGFRAAGADSGTGGDGEGTTAETD